VAAIPSIDDLSMVLSIRHTAGMTVARVRPLYGLPVSGQRRHVSDELPALKFAASWRRPP
jgi:hypothetical protein